MLIIAPADRIGQQRPAAALLGVHLDEVPVEGPLTEAHVRARLAAHTPSGTTMLRTRASSRAQASWYARTARRHNDLVLARGDEAPDCGRRESSDWRGMAGVYP